MLYPIAIAIHVLVAVLAIGLVGAIPLTARLACQAEGPLAGVERILGAMLRAVQVGLSAMFLTGVLLDISVSGAFHRAGWFKASIVMLVLLGVSLARARGALRQGFAPGGVREQALGQVERWGWVVCGLVAGITILMQTKPLP